MIEPKLKKKSFFSKIFKNQFLLTICTVFLLIFILVGSSYALLNTKVDSGLTDVVVQSGNLQATITSEGNIIEKDYNTLGVSDEIGLTYNPYTFTVTNSSENNIAYYELRVVDKEYEISTLPHKSLNYALSVNGSNYTNPQNLGDNRSYIYVGGSLDVGESDTFNLKLWVNEEFGKYANNKVLRAAIELTLYSDIPTRNYIIYDSQGGSYIPKTNVVSKRISMQTPIKAGYSFIGWSSTPNGEVEYESNAIYNGNNGMTVYAVWGEATITYNLNGGIGDIPSNKASEGVTALVPTKSGYTFKGWSTTENGEVVYQSGDTYNGNSITLYAVWGEPPTPTLYETIEITLASYLLEPDGTGDYDSRIISGTNDDENLKNYVWYSGILWRVVALNNNGTVKLVTENNITSMSWNESNQKGVYEDSDIREWLNTDFLDTLYEYETFVVSDYLWNATEMNSYTKPANTTMISNPVGLLNIYEYNQANEYYGYLNNGDSWWTLTPSFSNSGGASVWASVWYVDEGDLYTEPPETWYGVRPSINLKSTVKIGDTDGDGKVGTGLPNDPYEIVMD